MAVDSLYIAGNIVVRRKIDLQEQPGFDFILQQYSGWRIHLLWLQKAKDILLPFFQSGKGQRCVHISGTHKVTKNITTVTTA